MTGRLFVFAALLLAVTGAMLTKRSTTAETCTLEMRNDLVKRTPLSMGNITFCSTYTIGSCKVGDYSDNINFQRAIRYMDCVCERSKGMTVGTEPKLVQIEKKFNINVLFTCANGKKVTETERCQRMKKTAEDIDECTKEQISNLSDQTTRILFSQLMCCGPKAIYEADCPNSSPLSC